MQHNTRHSKISQQHPAACSSCAHEVALPIMYMYAMCTEQKPNTSRRHLHFMPALFRLPEPSKFRLLRQYLPAKSARTLSGAAKAARADALNRVLKLGATCMVPNWRACMVLLCDAKCAICKPRKSGLFWFKPLFSKAPQKVPNTALCSMHSMRRSHAFRARQPANRSRASHPARKALPSPRAAQKG